MKESNNISKTTGFKVPESYFENFEVRNLGDNIREHKSGFTVPKSYFEDFEVKATKQSNIINLNDKQKTFAIAASLLVLLGTLLLGLILNNQTNQEVNFSKLNKSAIENYLEDEMLMDTDMYVENEDLYFKIPDQNFSENEIIDNMDDSSIEQLIDY